METAARPFIDAAAVTAQETRNPIAGAELLVTEAARHEESDPALAAELLAEAGLLVHYVDPPRAEVALRRSAEISDAAGLEPAPLVELTRATLLLFAGRAGEGERLLEAALARDLSNRETCYRASTLLFHLERYDDTRELLEQTIASMRSEAPAGLIDTLAAVEYRSGRWLQAEALSTEALRLAREAGEGFHTASCLTTLARLAAVRGREQECRDRVREALDISGDEPLLHEYAWSAIGLLELGLDRPQKAFEALSRLGGEDSFAIRAPGTVQWIPDQVEALVRVGRRREAADIAERLARSAETTRHGWAQAATERCRGLLASPKEIDGHFGRALELHGRTTTPFELARTELCYGERLRRARRHADARRHLGAALEVFQRLGAAPWAERARRELGASGRATRRKRRVTEELTPYEMQVVELVERGATNKEAAAALFLSPKTVEYHLASVYRKLEVRSRTELVRLLATEGR